VRLVVGGVWKGLMKYRQTRHAMNECDARKEGNRRSLKKRPRSVGGQRSLNGQSNFRPIYGLTLVAINICLVCAQVTAGARSYLGYSSCLLAGSTTDLLASHAHNVFNHVSQVASRSVCLSVCLSTGLFAHWSRCSIGLIFLDWTVAQRLTTVSRLTTG